MMAISHDFAFFSAEKSMQVEEQHGRATSTRCICTLHTYPRVLGRHHAGYTLDPKAAGIYLGLLQSNMMIDSSWLMWTFGVLNSQKSSSGDQSVGQFLVDLK